MKPSADETELIKIKKLNNLLNKTDDLESYDTSQEILNKLEINNKALESKLLKIMKTENSSLIQAFNYLYRLYHSKG